MSNSTNVVRNCTGTVKFYNVGRGFGIVTHDETGEGVFLGSGDLAFAGASSISADAKIKFDKFPDTSPVPRNPRCKNIEILSGQWRPIE